MRRDTRNQGGSGPHKRRAPQPVGEVLAQLLARRGYAQQKGAGIWAEAWSQAAGAALARNSRAGELRGGVLEVIVKNSILMQDIAFEKKRILEELKKQVPTAKLRDLRFRVGAVD